MCGTNHDTARSITDEQLKKEELIFWQAIDLTKILFELYEQNLEPWLPQLHLSCVGFVKFQDPISINSCQWNKSWVDCWILGPATIINKCIRCKIRCIISLENYCEKSSKNSFRLKMYVECCCCNLRRWNSFQSVIYLYSTSEFECYVISSVTWFLQSLHHVTSYLIANSWVHWWNYVHEAYHWLWVVWIH